MKSDNNTAPLPIDDRIPMQISDTKTNGMVTPTYPVIQYGHVPEGGDAMSGGYVYQGKALPVLRGKYLLADITTGHVWYTDFKDMLAADDGDPKTMAPLHVVNILWDKPDGGKETYGSMAPVTDSRLSCARRQGRDFAGPGARVGRPLRYSFPHRRLGRALHHEQERWRDPRRGRGHLEVGGYFRPSKYAGFLRTI